MCFVFRGKKKKKKKAVIRPCHSGEFFLHASFRFRKIGDAAFASVRACVGNPPGAGSESYIHLAWKNIGIDASRLARCFLRDSDCA